MLSDTCSAAAPASACIASRLVLQKCTPMHAMVLWHSMRTMSSYGMAGCIEVQKPPAPAVGCRCGCRRCYDGGCTYSISVADLPRGRAPCFDASRGGQWAAGGWDADDGKVRGGEGRQAGWSNTASAWSSSTHSTGPLPGVLSPSCKLLGARQSQRQHMDAQTASHLPPAASALDTTLSGV